MKFHYRPDSIYSYSEQKRRHERLEARIEAERAAKAEHQRDKVAFMDAAERAVKNAGYDMAEQCRAATRAATLFKSIYPQPKSYKADTQKLNMETFNYENLLKRSSVMNRLQTETAQKHFNNAMKDAIEKLAKADKIREIYKASVEKAKEDLKEGFLGENGYHQVVQEAAEKANAELEALKSTLDVHSMEYGDRVAEYGALSGSKITEDVKLLDGSLSLSAADIDTLLDRYSDNYLMQSRIWDYWTQKRRPEIEAYNARIVPGMYGVKPENTTLKHKLQTPKEKQEIFDKYITTLKNQMGSIERRFYLPDGFASTEDFIKSRTGEYLSKNIPENGQEYDMTQYAVEHTAPRINIF